MSSQQNYRVDSFVSGLAIKAPVKVATTANITLSGEQTVNTVALLEGDRCLVKDQTNPVENGIYTVEQSAWQRAGDFDGNRDVVKGTLITVELPGGDFEIWQVTSATPNIGVDSITIEKFLTQTAVDPSLQDVTNVGAVTTATIDMQDLVLTEAAIPAGPGTGKGRIWVKTGNPNELWWTNEAGTHTQLGTGGTGGLNNVIEDSTPELGGNLGCLDNEVQRAELKDYAVSSSSPTISVGAITFDCTLGNAFQVTLNANITSITLSNPPASGNYGEMTIKFVQDAIGSRTVAGWPASVKWPGGVAPTITITATTGTDLIHLETWDGGTTWFGTVVQDFS
jgi:hypothetical protein